MNLYDIFIAPIADYAFMQRALVGTVALSVGSASVGVFLVIRRMSLMGDAMAHAILPGAAIGYLIAGFSLFAMTLGGLIAGLVVAIASGLVARATPLREDASLASFYLISLSVGVLIVSLEGSNVDLLHLLFGSVLAVDDGALLLMAGTASLTLVVLALVFRPLVGECLDPGFLRHMGGSGRIVHFVFLCLVVLNFVAGFHALGTLMAVAMMVLAPSAARFWSESLGAQLALAILLAIASSVVGLLVSWHAAVSSGPAITLTLGLIYTVSIFAGPYGGIFPGMIRRPHLQS